MADTATIEFDEYPDKSFRVDLHAPMAVYFDISERLSTINGPTSLRELVEAFAPLHTAWEGYEGEPTADAILEQLDMNLLLAIVGQWAKGVAQAPLPLPRASGAGGPSKARRASRSRQR